jgi:hypothetical protein
VIAGDSRNAHTHLELHKPRKRFIGCGKLTLRYASRLHHLGIGTAHAGTKVLILVTATTVTVIARPDNQLIASHHIDPDRNYWRNQQKHPGRWPGRSVTDDATHM